MQIETRLAQTEEALRRAERRATAGQFAASVMHEITNPLEAISNLVYLARLKENDLGSTQRCLSMIEEQLGRVRTIARQTLTFYRETAHRKTVDLVQLIESALRMHDGRIREKNLRLRRELPERAFSSVREGEILQVLTNLLANAIDASPMQGWLCIRVRIRGERVHIVIADTGHGIPMHFRPQLFQPFATNKPDTGNGLGLWVVKSLVEKHGGRICYKSSVHPGKSGTAFRVALASAEEGTLPERALRAIA